MNTRNNKEKTTEYLTAFAAAFIFIFVAYSLFLNDTVCYDHLDLYREIESYPFLTAERAMSYGRMGLYIFNKIFYGIMIKLGMTKLYNEGPLQIMQMGLLALSVLTLYKMYTRKLNFRGSRIILPVIISLAFVNSFFVDNLLYVVVEYAFAIYLVTLAVGFVDRKKYIPAALLIFVVVNIYQSYYILFYIWGTVLIFLNYDGKPSVTAFKEYIYLGITGFIPSLANVLMVKLFLHLNPGAEDMKSVTAFGSNAGQAWYKYAISALYHSFITQLGLGPKYFLGVVLLIFAILMLAFFVAKKTRLITVLYFALISAALILYGITIFALGYDDLVPRVLFTCFASVSGIMLMGLFHIHFQDKWLKPATMILGVTMLLDVAITKTCCTDYYVAMAHDKQMVGVIAEYIREYENETGNEVTTLATSQFDYAKRQNEYQIMGYTIPNYIQKSAHAHWCRADMINFFEGTDLVDEFISEDAFNRVFSDVEMNEFNPDTQLVFEGDTLYWAVY